MFSFKKSPFTLEFQMPRGQNVSRLLATSFKILVANTQSLVALATSESQFRTLKENGKIDCLYYNKLYIFVLVGYSVWCSGTHHELGEI